MTKLGARWFNVLFALFEGVLGPTLAVTAIVLAAANKHLLAAAIVVGLALVFYCTPYVTLFHWHHDPWLLSAVGP